MYVIKYKRMALFKSLWFVNQIVVLLAFFVLTIECNLDLNDRRSNTESIVKIPFLGSLRGSIATTKWSNRKYYQFLGVPYAEAPIGARRFKAPVPLRPWSGIRNALENGQICPQDLVFGNAKPSKDAEDCLNMNIFTPKIPKYESRLRAGIQYPVLIFIHGGSFVRGSALGCPASYFMERDVVMVVPNYRLNALGFLSTKTAEIPGNAALLDILLVLKWVKKNIIHFGGNPNKITISGQSSGAAMVSSLLLSPLVPDNLFQQMIIHSGSIFSPWAYTDDPISHANEIAWLAGVPKNATMRQINDFFMGIDVYRLHNATEQYYSTRWDPVSGRSLTVGGPSNYLPLPPVDLLLKGSYKKDINLVVGIVKDEATFITTMVYDFLNDVGLVDKPGILPYVLATLLEHFTGKRDWAIIDDTQYLSQSSDDSGFVEFAPRFSKVLGNILFKEPVFKLAIANKMFNRHRTFLYTFDYHGEFTRMGYGKNASEYPFDGGVHHSDDLIYLFPSPAAVANLNVADERFSKNLIDVWYSFIKNGFPQQWPHLSSYWGPYVHINEHFSVGHNFSDEFN